MAAHARTQIGSLSGGQRRRAFLARALASEPDLYLLDEPVTGVDPTTQEDLMAVLDAEARVGAHRARDHPRPRGRRRALPARHRRQPAGSSPTAPPRSCSTRDVLARAYGGHLLILKGQTVLLDDAHHHDSGSPRRAPPPRPDAPRRGGPR